MVLSIYYQQPAALECSQIPEKSGMGAVLSFGGAACPKAGVATAAATANTRGKFRHCESIALLLLFRRVPLEVSALKLHLLRRRLEGGGVQQVAVSPLAHRFDAHAKRCTGLEDCGLFRKPG
jgi:hypothetical protein